MPRPSATAQAAWCAAQRMKAVGSCAIDHIVATAALGQQGARQFRHFAAQPGTGGIDDQVKLARHQSANKRRPPPADIRKLCRQLLPPFPAVRLTISSSRGRSRNRGSSTPRAAPPAPSISTRRPCTVHPRLATMSRTRPMPSVLSPSMHAVSAARQGIDRTRPPGAVAESIGKLEGVALEWHCNIQAGTRPRRKIGALPAQSHPGSTSTARYRNCCPHCSANAA